MQFLAAAVVNRPRVYCPKCSEPARRLYYQEASAADAPKNRPVAGWAYCPRDDFCFKVRID